MSMHLPQDVDPDLEPKAVPSSKGFCVQLQGASILDLVQLQCLAGSQLSARITAGRHVGFLHFAAGGLVHAEFNHLSGEQAALAILALDTGSFEAVDRRAPEQPSIRTSWQHLVLTAAQRKDEGNRNLEPRVPSEPFWTEPPSDEPETETLITGAPVSSVARRGGSMHPPHSESLVDDHGQALPYVQMDLSGSIVRSEATSEELAAIVSYAVRIAKLMGEDLGLEDFEALEAQYKDRRLIAFERAGLLTAVLTPQTTPITRLRQELGL